VTRPIPKFVHSIALISGLVQMSVADAQQVYKPKMEAGVAAAGIHGPAYPGSSISSDRFFFAPWFIYRSDTLSVKDGGINLKAYDSDRVIVDLGIGVALNADSSITPVREGMPDLDYLLELGPRINVLLFDEFGELGRRNRLNWKTSYRQSLSTDFKRLDLRGPVFDTELEYRWDTNAANDLSIEASVGALWLGNKLSDYIYAVEPQFATQDREAYDAQSGFLGFNLSLGFMVRPVKKMNLYFGLGLDLYDGTRNEQSPLFEKDQGTSAILAVSYKLYESADTVLVRDE